MELKPKKYFKWPAAAVNFLNPLIVFASAAGLLAELTVYKAYVVDINIAVDLIFASFFMIKLISYPSGKYFFKNYGWVDFLASLPGLTGLVYLRNFTGLTGVLRSLRVLRLLRFFSFINSIKKVNKVCVSVAVVSVIAIAAVDFFLAGFLYQGRTEYYKKIYELSRNRAEVTAQRDNDVVYYFDNLRLFTPEGNEIPDFDVYLEKRNNIKNWYVEVNLTNQIMDYKGETVPVRGILGDGYKIMRRHDWIMLILSLSIIAIAAILLISSSPVSEKAAEKSLPLADKEVKAEAETEPEIKAETVKETETETEAQRIGTNQLHEPGETDSAAALARKYAALEAGDITGEGDGGSEMADIIIMLEHISNKIEGIRVLNNAAVKAAAGEAAVKAVKASSKSIIDYIHKTINSKK